jgi:hypothetical protein
MSESYLLILSVLAAWRLVHLFNAEDGPWDLLVRLRRLAGVSFAGDLLDCSYCLSLWVSAPFAFVLSNDWPHRLMLWFAISGGACIWNV